jgi:hypothetical protein
MGGAPDRAPWGGRGDRGRLARIPPPVAEGRSLPLRSGGAAPQELAGASRSVP